MKMKADVVHLSVLYHGFFVRVVDYYGEYELVDDYVARYNDDENVGHYFHYCYFVKEQAKNKNNFLKIFSLPNGGNAV